MDFKSFFSELSDEELKEYYQSFLRVTSKQSEENEIFTAAVRHYVNASNDNVAKAAASLEMFMEIAERYYELLNEQKK